MFKELSAPDHVLAIKLSGKVIGDDIRKYRSILNNKMETQEKISVYVEFNELSDMSIDAISEGIKADFEFLSHLKKFNNAAYISDKEWPRAVVKFISPVLPNLKMKVFSSDQKSEAMEWVSKMRKELIIQKDTVQFLPTNKDDVLAFEINGVISSEEMPDVIRKFDIFFEEHKKVRLLNRMTNFTGIDPSVFFQSGLVSMKLAAIQKVERYAIIGAPIWMSKAIDKVNPVFPDIDIKTFSSEREQDAWRWLDAKLLQGTPSNEVVKHLSAS